MHVKVELSNVLQTTTIAGVQQPIIGKQTDEADIRMKDGEVNVMGGLADHEHSASIAGVPGVTNLPLLGYIFGAKTKTSTDNEILIAMIPHIVRPPDLSAGAGEGVFAGTERVVRVQRGSGASTPAPGQGTQPQPGAPANAPSTPGSPLSPVPSSPVPGGARPQTVPPVANPTTPPAGQPPQAGVGVPSATPGGPQQNPPQQNPPQQNPPQQNPPQ